MSNKENDVIEIVCNIDDKYTKYCVVMLISLLENNKGLNIHINIISESLNEESIKKITNVVEDNYNQSISFYYIDESVLRNCKIYGNSHISIATYYRIFITSILPDSISKVLYLDCDLIVDGSIKELWNKDINNYAVGCIEDMWSGKENNYSRLNYSSSYSYFNAGVLLINLALWRKMDFEEKALRFIDENQEKLIFNDQDVLNGLLYDNKLLTDFKWNMQDGFYRRRRRIRKESIGLLDENIKDAVIVHFTGSKKPWQLKSQHPLKNLYFKYLDMSIWKGERPQTNMLYEINRRIVRLLVFLHLKKEKYLKLN